MSPVLPLAIHSDGDFMTANLYFAIGISVCTSSLKPVCARTGDGEISREEFRRFFFCVQQRSATMKDPIDQSTFEIDVFETLPSYVEQCSPSTLFLHVVC